MFYNSTKSFPWLIPKARILLCAAMIECTAGVGILWPSIVEKRKLLFYECHMRRRIIAAGRYETVDFSGRETLP